MVTQYDEKGKIFTQVVEKHPIEVMIQTPHNIIQGIIHVRPGMRVKDELNGQEHFLAVTSAVICDHANNELYQTGFMVVNVEHILWVIPKDELPK